MQGFLSVGMRSDQRSVVVVEKKADMYNIPIWPDFRTMLDESV
jgi:hypothetical protein